MGVAREARASLWRPCGSRKVVLIETTAKPAELRARGFGTLVLHAEAFTGGRRGAEAWVEGHGLEIVGSAAVPFRAGEADERWLVVSLRTGGDRVGLEPMVDDGQS